MATIDVFTPGGKRHRHPDSAQNGRPEIRERADGGIVVVGVHDSPEVRKGGAIIRQAQRTEKELGSYPPGTTFEYVTL